jgi:4-hydroxy-2-oxoheptanedioate aldolase
MRKSIVKRKLKDNTPCLFTTLHFTDPSAFEMVSTLGFDSLWMDTEHHAYSIETAGNLVRATRVGDIDVMIRPAKWEFMQIGRILETGATGILYPRCDDAEEARTVVRWAKFYPMGTRGADGGNPDMPYLSMPVDEYIKMANEETFIGVQIEDATALESAEAMAAVDGVDFLFLGPGDFSILGGFAGQMDHPKIQNALERIAAAAANTGKHWGCPVTNAEHAREIVSLGGRIIAWGSDLGSLKRTLEGVRKEFTAIIGGDSE